MSEGRFAELAEKLAKNSNDDFQNQNPMLEKRKHGAPGLRSNFRGITQQYTVGDTPTNKKHDGSYRKVKLETKNKEYSVLTRRDTTPPRNRSRQIVSINYDGCVLVGGPFSQAQLLLAFFSLIF